MLTIYCICIWWCVLPAFHETDRSCDTVSHERPARYWFHVIYYEILCLRLIWSDEETNAFSEDICINILIVSRLDPSFSSTPLSIFCYPLISSSSFFHYTSQLNSHKMTWRFTVYSVFQYIIKQNTSDGSTSTKCHHLTIFLIWHSESVLDSMIVRYTVLENVLISKLFIFIF